jgi:hypothetical protein
MKTNITRLLFVCVTASVFVLPSAIAQRQLGKKKGPTSKLYVSESKGDSEIQTDGKVYATRQATAFDAPGTVIETKKDSHNAFVYSNGTGMYVDENTRVEIDRFVQEPFKPQRNQSADDPVEPSVSQSDVFVSRGAVGICTSNLVSGSSMNYSTPEASINIRGGKVSIQTNANESTIDLLEGDVTVRGGSRDVGGQILRPGERATIRPGAFGQPAKITIAPIPPAVLQAVDERVTIACNARKTVTFEAIERKAAIGLDGPPSITTGGNGAATTNDGAATGDGAGSDQEIVAKPRVPGDLPVNVVVSPDRLPGT